MCNGTAATSSRTLSVLLAPQGFRLLLLRSEMEKISGMMATTQVGSNLPARAQAQVGKILSTRNGAITIPRTSVRTQRIGGRTIKAVEKMTKMVKAKSAFTGSM